MITFKTKDFNYVGMNDRVAGECLSTDTKPTTGIANGSTLLEMDTATLYIFSQAGLEWIPITAGGGGDSWTVLTEESVTTSVTEGDPYASGRITYVELITEDTIKITFNDMEYTCQNDSDGIANRFGAPWSDELNGYDFSVYPFAISSIGINGSAMNTLYTETAGTYTIKIEAPQSGGSSDFSTAIEGDGTISASGM